jgi:hypothetical protein
MTPEERQLSAPRIHQRMTELLQSEPVQFVDEWVAKIKAASTEEEAWALACTMVRRYILRDRVRREGYAVAT